MAISTDFRGVRANPELRSRATQVLEQTAQQRPNLPSDLQHDRTRMSDELIDEVGTAMQTQGSNNLEALLGAVTQNFLNRKAEEVAPTQEAGNKSKKMDVEWAPEVRAGEIMPPQGYTGQLIYKESKDQPKDEGVQPAGKAGKASKPGPGAGAPNRANPGGAKPAASTTGANSSAQKSNSVQDNENKSDDTVELTAEGQKMAQKVQQGGMKPAGVDAAGDKKGGAKSEERVDVHMPAAGVTQLVDVRPAGQLAADGVLGTYRKLDDMPSFNGAILRKRTGKEIVQEHQEKQQRGEQVQPLSEEQQRRLVNPVATDK